MMDMDKRLVRTFWKIADFVKEDGTELEKTQVNAVFNLLQDDELQQQELEASNRFLGKETKNKINKTENHHRLFQTLKQITVNCHKIKLY